MAKEFADKIVLVTGGASGIGKATAESFAREGAHVVVADFNRETGAAAVKGITGGGGQATFQYCDVRDKDSVDALFAFIRNTFGKLHCAVNNAGIDPEVNMTAGPDLAVFDAIHATNVRGVFLCLEAETKLMGKGGCIVNLSSFAGTNGIGHKPAYVSAKHAVLGMTRAMALQFIKKGIRINALCPGPVDTPMMQANVDARPKDYVFGGGIPIDRVAAPQEMADIILWLCSDRSSYVVGQGIAGDGGMTA